MISVPVGFKLILLGVVLAIIGFFLAALIGVEFGVYTLWSGLFISALGFGLLVILLIKRLFYKR